MPYVECERCGLTAFSAAYRFSVEYCPRCGATLPRRPSTIDIERVHPLPAGPRHRRRPICDPGS
jgi:hypothetical protein